MTKKKGAVWKHWTIITQNQTESNKNNSHPTVQCNYCSKVLNRAVPARMQNHLDKECLGAPDNAKSKKNINLQGSTTSTIHTPTITPNTTHTNIPVKRIKITKTSKIENFVDRISEEEQDDLEFQLAQALFSAGVPFAFVENPLVIQFFKCLRPSFKLPNRRKLAGDLLNDVYDEVKLQTDEQISKANTLYMVSDGWSNINQESVQNFIICTPKPVFFNATFSGEESHTGEWILNEIIQQIEAIGVQKFSAVIMDTASVMKSAWRRIEEKYSNVVCLGCNSHVINLLIGDVLKINEIKPIVENSKMIVNYFKSHVQAAAKLKRIQGENYNKEIALVLPVLTRWGSHLSCFQSLQKSKTALEQTLMDPDICKKINNTVRNFVLSENFWDMLDTIIKFLEPIVIALKFEISCNFSNNIQQLVQKRWDYTYHPVMMAAYMLDPCFLEESKNTDIEATRYREFTEFTSKRFGQEESVIMFTELVKFRQKNSPYDNKTIWLSSTNLSPSVWWQSWPNSSLQQLAIKILSILTSSAAAERNFSTFGFINNKICNRLQNERVKKLVYIYGNLQLYEKGLKRKLIHDRRNDNNNNDINNNNNTGNDNNNDDDDRIFGLELNITDLATE
ncbi:zinc finger BED domain-containing protein 1-like [Rhizophagus irregularis DAOM 181602=DAOM 197198]|nr:zinc finger BED domain-containing protein 1-like [Rhizophagus irregularis DAOM 181602=DAOM 197198]